MTDGDTTVGIDDLVDREMLRTFLREELGDADGMTITRHGEGHSNETLFLDWGDRELVLRRPPPGETAETAHDVLREHRVLSALADTAVPVPETVLACDDASVIGAEFFVMERLEGVVPRTVEPAAFADHGSRERVGEELLDVLTAIHEVDDEAVGLGDYGRPAGYLDRQVGLWREQMEEWLLPRTADERAVPGVHEVGDWLAENVPEEADHALVQGDYKLDNIMFSQAGDTREPDGPEIVGVFDWEMSTLGDPLTDLAWLLLFWRDADDPDPELPRAFAPRFTATDGYPTRRELVAGYERRRDVAFTDARFYRALAAYKLATACEAFYLRHLLGQSDDPVHAEMEAGVPALIDRARAVIEGDRSV